MIRHALRSLWPHRRLVGLSIVLTLATFASSVLLMGSSSWLIATAALQPSIAVLQVAIVGVRAFGIARGVLRYLERLVSHDTAFRVMATLRLRLFDALAGRFARDLADDRSGDLLTRLVDDVESLEHAYVRIVAPVTAALVGSVGLVAWALAYNWTHAVGLAVGLVAAGVVVPLIAIRTGRRSGRQSIEARAALQVAAVDTVQGLGELIALGVAPDWGRRTGVESLRAVHAQRSNHVIQAGGNALAGLSGDLTAIALLALTIPLVRAESVSGVHLAVVTLVTLAAFELVSTLPQAWQGLEAAREAAVRVFAAADGVPDRGASAAGARWSGVTAPAPPWRRIEVKGLSYEYPTRRGEVVTQLDMAIERGRIVALVGPSGSGKSTVAALLVRWIDPPPGSVLIDGCDILALTAEDVRRHVALAAQRVHLFTGTIRDNLLLANPEAADAELWEGLDAAALGDEVRSWPAGLDTSVGVQGRDLSGGERQRLALARALLTDAPFLVLDEPTSHLDADAEARVCATIAAEGARRGILLITHRPSTARVADEVITLG